MHNERHHQRLGIAAVKRVCGELMSKVLAAGLWHLREVHRGAEAGALAFGSLVQNGRVVGSDKTLNLGAAGIADPV